MSYPAAWRIKHKLLCIMAERESRRQLHGRVAIDDAYLGGERAGTPGRGSSNKVGLVIAVGTRDDRQACEVALRCMPFRKAAIADWANIDLAADTQVVSDGLPAFKALRTEVTRHTPIVSGSGRAAVQHSELQAVNIVLGNLKTAITGTYYAFKFAKYAPRYLAEFQYRFNRRFGLRSILPRLVAAAARTRPRSEPVLRMAEFRF